MFPKYPSKEYENRKITGRLLADLGEVIVEQYGWKESIQLLQQYRAEKKKAESLADLPPE